MYAFLFSLLVKTSPCGREYPCICSVCCILLYSNIRATSPRSLVDSSRFSKKIGIFVFVILQDQHRARKWILFEFGSVRTSSVAPSNFVCTILEACLSKGLPRST